MKKRRQVKKRAKKVAPHFVAFEHRIRALEAEVSRVAEWQKMTAMDIYRAVGIETDGRVARLEGRVGNMERQIAPLERVDCALNALVRSLDTGLND
jgi:hypothetical protein